MNNHELARFDAERHAGQCDDLLVGLMEEPVERSGLDRRRAHDHANELVTVFQGSTLSAPWAPERVRIAVLPLCQNS